MGFDGIDGNVVVGTNATRFGWAFFQDFVGHAPQDSALAHDNHGRGNVVCDAGPAPAPPHDGGGNLTGTVHVAGDSTRACLRNMPASAAATIRGAGPRV